MPHAAAVAPAGGRDGFRLRRRALAAVAGRLWARSGLRVLRLQPHPPAELPARQARPGGARHSVLLGLPRRASADSRQDQSRHAGRQRVHPQCAAHRCHGSRLLGVRQRGLGACDPFHHGGHSGDLAPAGESMGSAAGRCAQQARLARHAVPALHPGPEGRGDGGVSRLLQRSGLPQCLSARLGPGARIRAGALSRAKRPSRRSLPGRAAAERAGEGQGAETPERDDAFIRDIRLFAGADTR